MQKPVIGITASQDDGEHIFMNHQMYARCILEAGGLPVLLPPSGEFSDYGELLGRLDGILFSGGVDVHPKYFGEECLDGFPMSYQMTPERDIYEIGLYQAALRQDMPLLGICRGIQLMAIAGGGSIHQDIDACMRRPVRIRHAQKAPDFCDTHRVYVEKGSRLYEIAAMHDRGMPSDVIQVNSMHHQAVSILPEGYIISGFAPDGVIEAMEAPGKRFCLGVQWHPERMTKKDAVAEQIFLEFVNAAKCEA